MVANSTRHLKMGGLICGGSLVLMVAAAAAAAATLIVIINMTTTSIQTVDAHSLTAFDGSLDDQSSSGNSQQQTRQQQNGRLAAQANSHHNGGPANQNRCQSGWMWFNNKCWVTTQSRRDFIHAVELCKRMYNSTLPTIHSDEENEFLKQNIELANSPIWLYARHNHQYNKTRWLDKTPVNYTHWDAGQPSDKSSLVCIKTEDSWYMKKAEPVDGQTECVSFWNDAKWGTQVGCLVLLPVVCEKKLTPISRYNSDGPNGTISSQFEQQQMYNPISGSDSITHGGVLRSVYAMTLVLTSFGFVSFEVMLGQAVAGGRVAAAAAG